MSKRDERCAGHDDRAAVARCSRCALRMCGECYRHRADGHPCCARCAYAVDRSQAGRGALAVAFVGMSVGVGTWALRRVEDRDAVPALFALGLCVVLVVAFGIYWSGRPRASRSVELTLRDVEEEVEAEALATPALHPYRGRTTRALASVTPRVSGKATALVVGGSLLFAAAAFPAAVRLPRWLEVEGVLGLWWVVFASVLSVLLYRGFRLRDDLVYFLPWAPPEGSVAVGGDGEQRVNSRRTGGSLGWADGCNLFSGIGDVGCADAGEGVLVLLALAAAALVLLGGAWVLAELAFPVVLVTGYLATLRGLGRVARDRHECRGDLVRSLGWGALWATIYVSPLGLLTWLVHVAAR